MFSLEIDCDPEDRDMLIAELWEQGSAGIVELNPLTVRAFFEDGSNRAALLKLFPGAREREEEQRDWVQSARDLLQPMEVGRRFFLAPEWRDDPTPEGRFRIVVNPGMAFGTGVHETTRLCIEALEDFLEPGSPAESFWPAVSRPTKWSRCGPRFPPPARSGPRATGRCWWCRPARFDPCLRYFPLATDKTLADDPRPS